MPWPSRSHSGDLGPTRGGRRHPHRRSHQGVRRPRRDGAGGRRPRPRRAPRARSSGCSARTARARRRPSACSRPGSIPTGGHGVGRRHRRGRATRPRAKQVIGVVPQTNTLDRSLDVCENLYFHGRLLRHDGHDRAQRRGRPRLLEQFRLADRAKGRVDRLSGGMAQRLMVARAIMHRPATSCSSTSRPPGSTRRAASRSGRSSASSTPRPDDPPHHALHGGGRPALRPGRDHRPRPAARARHARASSSASLGADTEVRVQADGDLDALVAAPRSELPRCDEAPRRSTTGATSYVRPGGPARCPRSFAAADRSGFQVTDVWRHRDRRSRPCSSTSPGRTSANDRCRSRRHHARAGAQPSRHVVAFRALLAPRPASCCARQLADVPRPHDHAAVPARSFVFTYVFPKIGQGVGGTGAARAAVLDAARRRRDRPSRSSSRASRPWRSRSCRSSATPARSRTACSRRCRCGRSRSRRSSSGALQAVFAGAHRVPDRARSCRPRRCTSTCTGSCSLTMLPLAAACRGALGLTIGTRVEPRQVPLMFSILVIPMTFLGAVYYPWSALGRRFPWLKIAVLVNPLVYMSEGFRAALDRRPAHVARRGLRRTHRVHRRVRPARARRLPQARPHVMHGPRRAGAPRSSRSCSRRSPSGSRSRRLPPTIPHRDSVRAAGAPPTTDRPATSC